MSAPDCVPAWREPMLWLVFGLPATSVVAAFILIAAATGPGANDASSDIVRRTSQIQESDLTPDLAARELGLAMHLRVDESVVELRPVGHVPAEAPLQLTLSHPTQAARDVHLALQPVAGLWRADVRIDASHDWNLRLVAADGAWRIAGRLPRGERSALLAPALSGP